MRIGRLAAAATIFLLAAGHAGSAERPVAPVIPALKASAPPLIDGRLDDAVWTQASKCSGFWSMSVPGERAPEDTTVYLLYDSHNLYFGFDCLDAKPQEIKAEQRKRNGAVGQDDYVGVDLDVLNHHNEAYAFIVTPRGTQVESIPGGAATQVEWRGDWRAAAAITDHGWQAEMAIPVRNLRYPPGATTLGLVFTRRLARLHQTTVWPNLYQPGYDPELGADWAGLTLRRRRDPLVTMPYALTDNRPDRRIVTTGLDLKQESGGGLTSLVTFNPDFRTIEDDVESADFSYTERLLAERRPFFAEGASVYFPPNRLFYSRRIGQIDLGLKTFGRTDSTSIGVLGTTKLGDARDVALYGCHDLDSKTHLWSGFVHHTGGDEPTNTAGAVGYSSWYPVGAGSHSLSAYVYKSLTAGPGGDGMACSLGLSQSKDNGRRSWSLSYDAVGSGYQSVDGYVPETGVWEFGGGLSGRSRLAPNESAEDVRMSWGLSGFTGHSPEGRRSDIAGSTTLRLSQDARLDLALDTGEHDNLADRTASVTVRRRIRDLYRQASVTLRGGKRAGENYGYLGFAQGLRPAPDLSVQLSAEHVSLAGPDGERKTQIVATAAYDLTDEKTVSSRLVVRSTEVNLFLAYRQALRAGPDLFILLGDPNADRTTARLATKVVWPLLQ